MSKKLLIIDGNALIHRAFHAIPNFMSIGELPTNAVYGFASVLHRTISDLQPTHLIVCFDTPEPTFRDKIFVDYRAHRPKADENLTKQFPIVKEFLNASKIKYVEFPGYEADDLIASVVNNVADKTTHVVILTGDRDIFQLINDNVRVLTPQLGKEKNGTLYDSEDVTKKFGVGPEHITDYKALVGDPSDNYKGIPGIGPKTAVELIIQFGSIEKIYKSLNAVENKSLKDKLKLYKKNALMSKKLAVLKKDLEISYLLDNLRFSSYDPELQIFFDTYHFRSLKNRFFAQENPVTMKMKKEKNKDQLDLF